jgi:PhoH-like ATPase
MAFTFALNEKYIDSDDDDDDEMYAGLETIDDVDARILEKLRGGCLCLKPVDVADDWEPLENSFVVLINEEDTVFAKIHQGRVVPVTPAVAYGIQGRNIEQVMALDALLNIDIPLVTVTGVAGTGKTLMALAAAIEHRKQYRQIFMARPVMPMGKDIGYLPGTMEEKMAPYMAPLMDNIAVIKEQFEDRARAARVIAEMLELNKLVVEPLTYIRGRSLSRSFLIVDEAQNLTAHEVKTIVTRAGHGTKIVLTGDVEQIDNKAMTSRNNGLADLIGKFKGQGLYAHINLIESERSPLAKLAGEIL